MIKINEKERALVNCKTGEILRPACWDDLILYHAYLAGKNAASASVLLDKVFAGEKVMSEMLAFTQQNPCVWDGGGL